MINLGDDKVVMATTTQGQGAIVADFGDRQYITAKANLGDSTDSFGYSGARLYARAVVDLND